MVSNMFIVSVLVYATVKYKKFPLNRCYVQLLCNLRCKLHDGSPIYPLGCILDTENLHVNKLVNLQTLTNNILNTKYSLHTYLKDTLGADCTLRDCS